MLVLFAGILMLIVPIAVSRYWMVLTAIPLAALLFWFVHWNALSAASEGYGMPTPGFLEISIPAVRDAAIYGAVCSVIFGVKRLFIRAKPSTPSNID